MTIRGRLYRRQIVCGAALRHSVAKKFPFGYRKQVCTVCFLCYHHYGQRFLCKRLRSGGERNTFDSNPLTEDGFLSDAAIDTPNCLRRRASPVRLQTENSESAPWYTRGQEKGREGVFVLRFILRKGDPNVFCGGNILRKKTFGFFFIGDWLCAFDMI